MSRAATLVYGVAQFASWILVGPVAAATVILALFGGDLTAGVVLAVAPPAILLGGLPAMLAGRLDRLLRKAKVAAPWRLVASIGVANASCALILAPLYFFGYVHGTLPLLLCLGGSAGATAAWLVSTWIRRLAGQNPAIPAENTKGDPKAAPEI